MESTRDITERKLWEQRQQLLLGELAHRVKNTLSVVQSIAHQTLRSSASADDFIERFGGRLLALGTAHSLLVQSDWHGADLGALARIQLEPYISDNPDRLRIEGEPVLLPADLATPFSLVLHELATNTSKYGWLARPQQRDRHCFMEHEVTERPLHPDGYLAREGRPRGEGAWENWIRKHAD